jgi:hypothetical protein
MARGTFEDGGKPIYLRIAEGKIVETVEEGAPGAVKRTTKSGKEVWERRDGYVDGVITSMFHKEREYNGEVMHSLVIRLRDKDEHYSLEVTRGSRYWVGILMRLPNVNMQKTVRFSPYDFEGKDDKGGMRKIIGINLYQNEQKIDPAWSKTNPGELPMGKQVRVNGKDVWDFEDRDAFLMNVFAEINDQLKTGDIAMGGEQNEPVAHADANEPEDDGLPF